MKIKTILVVTIILSISCGSSNSESAVDKGWNLFLDGNYSEARQVFQSAYEKNPQNIAAISGLAWSLLKIDSVQFALNFFPQALGSKPSPDVHAGLAFTKNILKNYLGSAESAKSALDLDSIWTFPYDPQINYRDLWILRAEDFFVLGDFSSALTELHKFDPSFAPDITTPAGKTQLANKIEEIRAMTKRRTVE